MQSAIKAGFVLSFENHVELSLNFFKYQHKSRRLFLEK